MRCPQATAEEDTATGPLRTGARQAGLWTDCVTLLPHMVEDSRTSFLTEPLPGMGPKRSGSLNLSSQPAHFQALDNNTQ